MTDSSDPLIDAARAGDPDAIERLLARHLPELHAFVRLRAAPHIRAKEETADIVQSACRDVLAQLDRFQYDGPVGFRRWLFTTVMRKIVDRDEHWRAQKRDVGREARSFAPSATSTSGRDDFGGAYHSFLTPSRELMAREEIARVEEAFASLPDDYRNVITLSRIVGLSHAEIGQEMGKTEGAARKLLFRALRVLAERLDIPDP